MSDEWGIGDPDKARPIGWSMIGEKDHGVLELLSGEHPHSRRDDNTYARDDHGQIHGFSGHRVLIDVTLRSYNYLKSSGLSGNEIRRGGECAISADRVPVYSFFFRDPQSALLKAHQLIVQLGEHPSGVMYKSEREKLVGRKIYYRDHPAVITRLMLDQGCVFIESADGKPFPTPAWARDPEQHYGDDPETSVKDDILAPSIWWFRK